VVAEEDGAEEEAEPTVRERVDGAALTEELSSGGIAGPRDRHLGIRGPHPDDRHLVPGERPRLVRADHRDRAEGLRCREIADQAVPPHHVLDAEGKRERHNRRETLRDHRHRERDADEEHLEQPPLLQETDGDRKHGYTDGDQSEVAAEPVHLPGKGRRFAPDPLGEAGDQPELRLHPGGDHETTPVPVDHRRAGKDHVAPLGKTGLGRERLRRLVDGRRLARQRRLVDHAPCPHDEEEVGRHPLPHLEENENPRHEPGRIDLLPLPIADDGGTLHEHLL